MVATAIAPDGGRWMRSVPSPSTGHTERLATWWRPMSQGVFDQRDHTRRLTMVRERIDDRAFLRLIRKWLKAGLLETDGLVVPPETGSPQGGGLSPVLAHVSWHDALDRWCETVVKAHCRGGARVCRDADDGVCAFRDQDDAERFLGRSQRGERRATSRSLPTRPTSGAAVAFSRACGDASRVWDSSGTGGQIAKACHVSSGVPRARSSRRRAVGSRHGSPSTGTCRDARATGT